ARVRALAGALEGTAVPAVGALEHRAPRQQDGLHVRRRRLAVAFRIEAARASCAHFDGRRTAPGPPHPNARFDEALADRLAHLDAEHGARRLAVEAHDLPQVALAPRVPLAQHEDELVLAVAGEIHELGGAHVA